MRTKPMIVQAMHLQLSQWHNDYFAPGFDAPPPPPPPLPTVGAGAGASVGGGLRGGAEEDEDTMLA